MAANNSCSQISLYRFTLFSFPFNVFFLSHFTSLSLPFSLLSLFLYALSFLSSLFSSIGICTRRNKGRLVSLSVRSEQDFQIKPCHFPSHWAPAPPWQVLTVMLPWQLPIWGLGGVREGVREAGKERGEGMGWGIKSSVKASQMAGLCNSREALYLWALSLYSSLSLSLSCSPLSLSPSLTVLHTQRWKG